MSDFNRLMELTSSEEVVNGAELPKVKLHKWLVLGQTEYLCKYGTLSDGHEKFTDSQKYAQSLKEAYFLSLNIQTQKALGMEAQADLLDAEEVLAKAKTDSSKLRANAGILKAKTRLISALTSVEDQMRMLRFYWKTIKELESAVELKYPLGIEQAEIDNWKAVANYRMVKSKTLGFAPERLDNIPLPPTVKAQLGIHCDRPDAYAPLMVENKDLLQESDYSDLSKFIDRVKNKEMTKELEEKQ